MRIKPDEDLGDGVDETVKVAVRPECFTGSIEELDWMERKPFDEFDFGYVRLTVGRRGAV
jgi:exodeoxyribonuclease-5